MTQNARAKNVFDVTFDTNASYSKLIALPHDEPVETFYSFPVTVTFANTADGIPLVREASIALKVTFTGVNDQPEVRIHLVDPDVPGIRTGPTIWRRKGCGASTVPTGAITPPACPARSLAGRCDG